jgi:hypothetical protein
LIQWFLFVLWDPLNRFGQFGLFDLLFLFDL